MNTYPTIRSMLWESRPQPLPASTPEDVSEFIRKNCRPFLSQIPSPSSVLWRGTSSPGTRDDPRALVITPRPDRQPRDSHKYDHKIMDQWISTAGCKANRTNSVFVSHEITTAGNYGRVRAVYPIGSFNYTWAPRHSDSADLPTRTNYRDPTYVFAWRIVSSVIQKIHGVVVPPNHYGGTDISQECIDEHLALHPIQVNRVATHFARTIRNTDNIARCVLRAQHRLRIAANEIPDAEYSGQGEWAKRNAISVVDILRNAVDEYTTTHRFQRFMWTKIARAIASQYSMSAHRGTQTFFDADGDIDEPYALGVYHPSPRERSEVYEMLEIIADNYLDESNLWRCDDNSLGEYFKTSSHELMIANCKYLSVPQSFITPEFLESLSRHE